MSEIRKHIAPLVGEDFDEYNPDWEAGREWERERCARIAEKCGAPDVAKAIRDVPLLRRVSPD